jgi:hypothetical protein
VTSPRTNALAAAAVLALSALAGCGGSTLPTHPVTGQVVFADGDVRQLAGNHVEGQLDRDPKIRAHGEIQADGSFTLSMVHEGKSLAGAAEGTYKVRLVFPHEDSGDESKPVKRKLPIHARYTAFKTSGLSFTVPTSGAVTLKVSKKG